ncbi:MAG: patatin-like phospholipase family protein [Spirochaeta sp.]
MHFFGGRSVVVLSIDGGGIRGLIAARVLEHLEKLLHRRNCFRPIGDLFDLIAGSSTGALIGLGLTMPPRTGIPYLQGEPFDPADSDIGMKRICEIYNRLGKTVFPPDHFFTLRTVRQAFMQKYSTEPFERLLNSIFGDTTLHDCRNNLLVTAYDTVRRMPYLFKFRRSQPDKYPNFYLRDVSRATTAAPTYFKPALIHQLSPDSDQALNEYCLIDGAVFQNNPAMTAYVEARKIFPKAKKITIVSLGSGRLHGAYRYDDIQGWGYMDWVSPMRNVPILTIMSDAQTSMSTYQLTRHKGVSLYRINQDLDGNVSEDMDDARPENIQAIEAFAQRLIQSRSGSLDQIADLLARRC